jgi:hypothetical protein
VNNFKENIHRNKKRSQRNYRERNDKIKESTDVRRGMGELRRNAIM